MMDGELIDKEMAALGAQTRRVAMHTAQETARNTFTNALTSMIKTWLRPSKMPLLTKKSFVTGRQAVRRDLSL
ncbi:hypothetical protein AWV80_35335 [Cupriavidus sp. UYMU48A]|nr:hypothetical protein AWV80_35335 [Cupriavidus sp. UYMU48A]